MYLQFISLLIQSFKLFLVLEVLEIDPHCILLCSLANKDGADLEVNEMTTISNTNVELIPESSILASPQSLYRKSERCSLFVRSNWSSPRTDTICIPSWMSCSTSRIDNRPRNPALQNHTILLLMPILTEIENGPLLIARHISPLDLTRKLALTLSPAPLSPSRISAQRSPFQILYLRSP